MNRKAAALSSARQLPVHAALNAHISTLFDIIIVYAAAFVNSKIIFYLRAS